MRKVLLYYKYMKFENMPGKETLKESTSINLLSTTSILFNVYKVLLVTT